MRIQKIFPKKNQKQSKIIAENKSIKINNFWTKVLGFVSKFEWIKW